MLYNLGGNSCITSLIIYCIINSLLYLSCNLFRIGDGIASCGAAVALSAESLFGHIIDLFCSSYAKIFIVVNSVNG